MKIYKTEEITEFPDTIYVIMNIVIKLNLFNDTTVTDYNSKIISSTILLPLKG